MSNRLEGKVAIIPDAGRGIGRVSAELFASEGASVVVADIDAANAETATQAILDAGGNAICFLASDEASYVSYVSGVVIPVDGGISGLYPTPTPDMDDA